MYTVNEKEQATIRGIPLKVLLCAACFGAVLGTATALAVLRYSSNNGRVSESKSGRGDEVHSEASLSGILYLEKSQRLAIYWKNGDFELWDTERGIRLGQVVRLPRRVGWCVASPDEATILTADALVDPYNSLDRDLWWKSFVPSIRIWDAKSGEPKHLIRVPETAEDPIYLHHWYARWLDDSRALLIRLERQNPARQACLLRLTILDTVAGRIVKASDEFEYAGEHLFLSPNRKMALLKADNYAHRGKDHGVDTLWRNIYARTHVFDLEHLAVVSSWKEPPSSPGSKERVALIARWCPDGQTVITVDDSWTDAHPYHPSPKVRFWDARSARLLKTLSGHTDHILDLAFTSSGDKLLTASEDRTVRVWDTRTGSLQAVFSGHAAGLNKVIVLPGDKLAVSAAEGTVAKVWDLTTGKLKFDLPDHDSDVRDLEVVSDQIVRTVTQRGTAMLWNCSTGKLLQTIPKPPDFPKRFGVCELVIEGESLHMRIVDQK